ncbi:hypothetical protein [Marinobacter vinifirmus]|uniref:hypothetical protein n=1 Tax=Marinobacter vinifirmus TaxID=355591 RepID=UPI0023574566|nr:hypothetical protein [Marinobacter vinifirmus]
MNNIMEIDLSKRLEIKINNKKPVGLEDLSLSLLAFNHQFHKFVESEANKETDISSELLIKEVRSGAYSRPRLPLIPDEACHPFHAKAATDSTAKLPPWQAA